MHELKKVFLLCRKGRFDILLHRLLSLFGAEDSFLPLPHLVMIEPTNACNLHCPTCPAGSGKMNRPLHDMNLAEFKGIIDQAKAYVSQILLWNYGEPFLHNELLGMIKYATTSGIYVKTSTNGGFFKSMEFCLKVVQSGLHYLIISLDGADQDTVNKFRKGADFNSIIAGMKAIKEAKESLSSATPVVELQFIVMKHNEDQRARMRTLAKELGADVYSEKTVNINCGYPEFQKMAKELVPNDTALSRYFLKQDGTFALKGKMSGGCSMLYNSLVINSDGAIVPCCYDLFSEHLMGNVFREDLKTVWESSKYELFRKEVKSRRSSIGICSSCPEGRYTIAKKTEI